MDASDAERTVYTPSEINREARLHLEAAFSNLWIEGEISSFKRAASGHCYFTLKDEKAALDCAWFRGSQSGAPAAARALAGGDKVLARGRLTLYEKTGRYQLVVERVEAAGEGLLQQRFEALKKQLAEAGLFDAENKRPLPRYPRRIAVITSPTGAAIRDILHVLQRRWPLATVRLYPVPVQGDAAAPAIVAAIEAAGRHGWGDLLIVGRGGGSLEDLWAFNEEAVARALAACPIPTVSAVGHETDTAITDFVADLRAPTPSVAAELATPSHTELREQFTRWHRLLGRGLATILQGRAQRLDHAVTRLQLASPVRRLADRRERLQQLDQRLVRAIRGELLQARGGVDAARRRLAGHHPGRSVRRYQDFVDALARRLIVAQRRRHLEASQSLSELARTLHALSPLPTLERGFAILTDADSGRTVTSINQLSPEQAVTGRLTDGWFEARVTSVAASSPRKNDDAPK